MCFVLKHFKNQMSPREWPPEITYNVEASQWPLRRKHLRVMYITWIPEKGMRCCIMVLMLWESLCQSWLTTAIILCHWQSVLTPLKEDCSESGYSHVYGTDAYQVTKSSSAKRHKNILQLNALQYVPCMYLSIYNYLLPCTILIYVYHMALFR